MGKHLFPISLRPVPVRPLFFPRSLALNNNGDEVALIGNDGIERHRISYTHNQALPGQEIHF